jgi:hypothetical protein
MKKRIFGIVFLSWIAMIAFDFLLHGGLLASFYIGDSPFLLPPLIAFQRIPIGYASFFLTALLINWLMDRFELTSWQQAFTFGGKLAILMWGALLLGLYSISTIEPSLAIAWLFGQSFQMAIGATVIFLGKNSESLKRLTSWVIGFLLIAFVATILLQNIGLAPQIIN